VRASTVSPRGVGAPSGARSSARFCSPRKNPRRDGVHADGAAARATELDGEPARQVVDRRLGDPVADDPGHRAACSHRREVDDRAAALRERSGEHRLAEDADRQQRSAQVERDHLVERLERQLEERPFTDRRGGDVPARCVDEDVHSSEALEHGVPGGLELRRVEHVGGKRGHVAAELARERVQPLGRACQEPDGGADVGERARDGAAEGAGRTGDDGDASLERRHACTQECCGSRYGASSRPSPAITHR
jgi:hypothetical protein